MRRLLYITPYFPPQARVGALRPLKFIRHLPEFGHQAVVLCDLRKSDALDDGLAESIPDDAVVVRDYSRHARAAERAWRDGTHRTDQPLPGQRRGLERYLPRFLDNPELIPLGAHTLDLPHASRAAARVAREHDVGAVVVSADPFAAALVGARLTERTGLPLLLDLRDPWALCDVRRSMRPAPSRVAVDRLERSAISRAQAVILNTELCRERYVTHYHDIDPTRFHVIRNHGDRELMQGGSHPGFDRFTLLHLGSFRRFVEGNALIQALSLLRERGIDESRLQLVVTGACPEDTVKQAQRLGVERILVRQPFVSLVEAGAAMRAADVLVAVTAHTRLRLPAKLYEYATAPRPILAISDNPELHDLCIRLGGACCFGHDQVEAIADYVEHELGLGRQREVSHEGIDLTSRTAAAKLAAILDGLYG